jgi:hypothetical protein
VVLPTNPEMQWPPHGWDPVAQAQRLWSAWFSGSTDQLSWAYQGLGGNSATGRAFFRTSGEPGASQRFGQSASSVYGSVDRYFWGQITPAGEKRTKLHVPIAGDIASTSADLLFAKKPRFEGATGPTQQWLDDRFDDGLHATLLEAFEVCAAMSGMYLRTVWDNQLSPRSWVDIVHPDAAVPTFKYGRLTSVTFWRVLEDTGDQVVRHLEQHDTGNNVIFHGVYVGDQQQLGPGAVLTDFEETAPIAAMLDTSNALALPDLPKDASTTTYIPNVRPNRLWRDINGAAALGRSDYAGVEGLMDALDECYSSWVRDIRLAKSRLMVPPSYLDSRGPGKAAIADMDKEVFVPINLLAGTTDASQITANQFKIRFQEHQATADGLTAAIVHGAGYSAQTFGENPVGSGNLTATEIEQRERRTLLTRAKKLNYARPGVADVTYSMLCVDRYVLGNKSLQPLRPDVTFPEAVLPSLTELSQTAVALNTAMAASKQTLVAMVHPDWTPDQVDEEVLRIRDEEGFDVLGRARVTLTPPMGSTATLGQEVQQIADTIQVTPESSPGNPSNNGSEFQP